MQYHKKLLTNYYKGIKLHYLKYMFVNIKIFNYKQHIHKQLSKALLIEMKFSSLSCHGNKNMSRICK